MVRISAAKTCFDAGQRFALIQLFDSAFSTYTYVLFDEKSREALIIDPVDDQIERDLAILTEHKLKLAWAVETHAHADHITSAGLIVEHTGA